MATIVNSIGSAGGRDFSTLQAWEDALPANLVTDGNSYQGEVYNDSEFSNSSGTLLTISGETTDATHFIILTAAAGQSFQDNASVRTNLLAYNQANGVALRTDTSYAGSVIACTVNYTVFSRLQLKCQTQGTLIDCSLSGTAVIYVDNCFLHAENTSKGLFNIGSGSIIKNTVLFVNNPSTVVPAISGFYGLTVLGCTIVRNPANSAAGTAVNASSGVVVESCAIFGFTTTITNDVGSKNNATDQATCPGTSNQTGITFTATTPFTQAGSSGTDLRSIASTSLAANGFLDGTNAPNDISKTARANPPTIGAWELIAAGAPARLIFQHA